MIVMHHNDKNDVKKINITSKNETCLFVISFLVNFSHCSLSIVSLYSQRSNNNDLGISIETHFTTFSSTI